MCGIIFEKGREKCVKAFLRLCLHNKQKAFIHLTSEATEEKRSFFEALHFFENTVTSKQSA